MPLGSPPDPNPGSLLPSLLRYSGPSPHVGLSKDHTRQIHSRQYRLRLTSPGLRETESHCRDSRAQCKKRSVHCHLFLANRGAPTSFCPARGSTGQPRCRTLLRPKTGWSFAISSDRAHPVVLAAHTGRAAPRDPGPFVWMLPGLWRVVSMPANLFSRSQTSHFLPIAMTCDVQNWSSR